MKKTEPKIKLFRGILVIIILLILPAYVVYADSEIKIIQAYVNEQTLYMFTDTVFSSDKLVCTVSRQESNITETGTLVDANVLIRTTVLVDISASMPASARDSVITTLNKMIEDKSGNEELKIVTFGEEVNVLQDFTIDRYDLAVAVGKIDFNNRETAIYDAIYNTIPQIIPVDNTPAFYRTIVFTDGVEATQQGITREELYVRLQNELYPIDVVAVSAGETDENRDLAAIVRMSSGRYFSLHPNTDTESLTQQMQIGDYFYLTAEIDISLLDGTTRQINLSDGTYSADIDIKFPVVDIIADNTSLAEQSNNDSATQPAETQTPVETPQPTEEASGDTVSVSIMTVFGNYTLYIYIAAAAVLFLFIIIITAIRKKKRKKENTSPDVYIQQNYSYDNNASSTEFMSEGNISGSQYTIRLSSTVNPGKAWTLQVNAPLLIGRAEHCQIRLDDKSVSREHCKIIPQSGGIGVVHLGSTNKTLLNGSNITGSCPLKSGDMLKLGREELRIDYIQSLDGIAVPPQQQQNPGKGETEAVFVKWSPSGQ